MDKPESPINIAPPNRTRKSRITTGIALICMHTIFWWLFEIYTNKLYYLIAAISWAGVSIDILECVIPSLAMTLKSILSGIFPVFFLVLLPKYAFLAICFSFLAFWTNVHVHEKPLDVYCLILSNFSGWTICYFYYQHWSPVNGLDDDVKYSKMYFDNPLYFYQLLIAVFVCYGLCRISLHEKACQNKARLEYEQRLLTLNKNLEEANQKLFKTNKELEEALQEKENFILRFSHEIRNPLNSLLGNVDLCQEYAEDEQSRQMLNEAKISGEILLQLLNNILDTAKVSTNRLDLSMHYQEIKGFLERAWVVCSEIIRRKKLYGCLSLNMNVPERIEFDSHRLMQILINVVSNAAKFTEHGYVKVFVDFEEGAEIRVEDMKPRYADSYKKIDDNQTDEDEVNQFELSEYPEHQYDALSSTKKTFVENRGSLRQKTLKNSATSKLIRRPDIKSKESITFTDQDSMSEGPKEGYLRLEIIDSGCGIKKRDLDLLFNKFTQVNEQSSKRQIGTGLGLWITKEIVELMRGRVEIYSVPNHGTAIVMMLKSKSGLPQPSRLTPNILDLSVQPLPSIHRAMIVEDIPYNQEINSKFLQKCGVQEISLASNGKEAVNNYLKKGEGYFDFILMDVDMPVMDGKTATKLIRQHETEHGWRPTPLVFLTAYSEAKMQSELLDPHGAYKADGFLSKPTSQATIKRTLEDMALKLQQRKRRSRRNIPTHLSKFSNEVSFKRDRYALLIDDDPYNLSIVSRMLIKCGFKPLEALNAKQALDLYDNYWKDINLVLTDCEMPVMDGIAVTKEIISRHRKAERSQRLSVYGLTGHIEAEYKKKCRDAGMRDVLEKPITMEVIRSLLLSNIE